MSLQMDAGEYWQKIQEKFQVTHFILTTGRQTYKLHDINIATLQPHYCNEIIWNYWLGLFFTEALHDYWVEKMMPLLNIVFHFPFNNVINSCPNR